MAYALKMIDGPTAICARKNDDTDIAKLCLDHEVLDEKRKLENKNLKNIIEGQMKLEEIVEKFSKVHAEEGAGDRYCKPPVEALLVEYQKQRKVSREQIKLMRETLERSRD